MARLQQLAVPALAALLLAASTPPAWFPGAEFLVLAGLAVWFVVASGDRPWRHSYALGCLHMAIFSWSVHHVMWIAWGLIVVLGGIYYALVHGAVRALPLRWRPLGFAVAVAGAAWLRANAPDIHYPHGQPVHALWQWPWLLGSVTAGGEALANALLAWLAATAAHLARSWQLAVPAWGPAVRQAAAAVGAFAACTAAGAFLRGAGDVARDGATVAVAAIEPGYHLWHELGPLPRAQQALRYRELIDQRLLQPTRDVLASPSPPDLVLWPESSLVDEVPVADVVVGKARLLAGAWPAAAANVAIGINVRDGSAPPTPAAALLELPSGRIVGHQEKQCLVPGGEFQPGLHYLPTALRDILRGWFEAALGTLPEATPGRELPPLVDRRGHRFGALLCYDNAFPGPAAGQVAMGARWLCVLTNESWYEGGAELTQLMAMTVVRALETGTPIVRCAQDGWSGVVGGDGVLREHLPLQPAPQPAARILRAVVPLGPGALPPLAWWRRWCGPSTGLALVALWLHAFVRRARLRSLNGIPVRAVSR